MRHSRNVVTNLISKLDNTVLKGFDYTVAGSYRREKPDCKDIDIIVKKFDIKTHKYILERLIKYYPNGSVKGFGDVNERPKGKYMIQWYVPLELDDILLDIHCVEPKYFETELLYFTGSTWFNIKMRKTAKDMGYKLNQYGLYKDEELITSSEKEIFDILKMEYVEPKNRKS